MKIRILPILIGTMTLLAIGVVGAWDYATELRQAVETTCKASNGATLTEQGRTCQELITRLDAKGYVTYSDGNNYWTEAK